MSEDAVEGDFSIFVGVEAFIEKIAQEAAILRNAFAIDALRGSDRAGMMLCVGSEIADGGEAQAGHHGILDDVDIFVDFAGLESAVEMNVAITRNEFVFASLRELPFRAGNDGAWGFARISNREGVAGIVRR